jgi:hypothetical protein
MQLLPIQVRSMKCSNRYLVYLDTYQPINCSYRSFCRFLNFLAYLSKLLMIYTTIPLTLESDKRLHYENVHGCGCAYSDWCFISEVHFDFFSTCVYSYFLPFSFLCSASYFFFCNPNVLPDMYTLLLHMLGVFTNIWSHSYSFYCNMGYYKFMQPKISFNNNMIDAFGFLL